MAMYNDFGSPLDLWVTHSFDKLFLESEKPDGARTEYEVYAAKNETEGVYIALRSPTVLDGLFLKLTTPDDADVAAQVFHVRGGILELDGKNYTDPAVPIDLQKPISLAAGITTALLLEFSVAPNACAGARDYRLSVTDADGRTLAEASIVLHVWNFALPVAKRFQSSVNTQVAPQKEIYEMLLSHNFCGRTLPVDVLSKEADAYLSDPRVNCFFVLNVSTDEYLTAVYEKLKDHPAWLGKACFYALDEPRTLEMAKKLEERCKRLRALCPDFHITSPFYSDVQIDEQTDQIDCMAGLLDLHCPKLSCWDDKNIYSAEQAAKYPPFASRMKALQARGDKVWAYVCNTPPKPYLNVRVDDEGIGGRVLFWQMYQRELDGFLYWNATYYDRLPDKDPWKSVDTFSDQIYGDGILIYPGEPVGVDGPVASIRLKLIRDGLDDIALFDLAEAYFGREWVMARVNKATSSLTSVDVTGDALLALRREIGDAIESASNT